MCLVCITREVDVCLWLSVTEGKAELVVRELEKMMSDVKIFEKEVRLVAAKVDDLQPQYSNTGVLSQVQRFASPHRSC